VRVAVLHLLLPYVLSVTRCSTSCLFSAFELFRLIAHALRARHTAKRELGRSTSKKADDVTNEKEYEMLFSFFDTQALGGNKHWQSLMGC
jgi:hypothetical protein